jgi:hypothetical protein
MRPGVGHILIGIVLLGGGIAITVFSGRVVLYGAIAVGAFEILRGLYVLVVNRPQ